MIDTKRRAFYLAAVLCALALGVYVWHAWNRQVSPKPVPTGAVESNEDRAPSEARAASALEASEERTPSPRTERAEPPLDYSAEAAAPSSEPPVEDDDRFANRSVEALMARLSSDDPHLVLDSADGLRARKAVEAIPKLASLDVAHSPDSARSVIEALGELAGVANPDHRKIATDRLLTLLEQEKARGAPDAPGNVLQIYEALGHTADSRAAAALERELSDKTVPLAALTVVAESLARLRQPSSVAPLSEARDRIATLAFDDELSSAVQKDVMTAIDAALVALGAR